LADERPIMNLVCEDRKIMTFKVKFLCKKSSQSFKKKFH
jgi:hypothetical protein